MSYLSNTIFYTLQSCDQNRNPKVLAEQKQCVQLVNRAKFEFEAVLCHYLIYSTDIVPLIYRQHYYCTLWLRSWTWTFFGLLNESAYAAFTDVSQVPDSSAGEMDSVLILIQAPALKIRQNSTLNQDLCATQATQVTRPARATLVRDSSDTYLFKQTLPN